MAERRSPLDPSESYDWRRSRVFVTGASGLLGSALTAELVNRGAEVTALLRDWVPASRLLQFTAATSINIVGGDLTDFALLTRALNEYEIDTVFHCGAQT